MQLRRLAPHGGEAAKRASDGIGGTRRFSASRAMAVRGRGGIAQGHPPRTVLLHLLVASPWETRVPQRRERLRDKAHGRRSH